MPYPGIEPPGALGAWCRRPSQGFGPRAVRGRPTLWSSRGPTTCSGAPTKYMRTSNSNPRRRGCVIRGSRCLGSKGTERGHGSVIGTEVFLVAAYGCHSRANHRRVSYPTMGKPNVHCLDAWPLGLSTASTRTRTWRASSVAHGYLMSLYCPHWRWRLRSVMRYAMRTFGTPAGVEALTPTTSDLSTFTTSPLRPTTAASREDGAPSSSSPVSLLPAGRLISSTALIESVLVTNRPEVRRSRSGATSSGVGLL